MKSMGGCVKRLRYVVEDIKCEYQSSNTADLKGSLKGRKTNYLLLNNCETFRGLMMTT